MRLVLVHDIAVIEELQFTSLGLLMECDYFSSELSHLFPVNLELFGDGFDFLAFIYELNSEVGIAHSHRAEALDVFLSSLDMVLP